MGPDFIDGWRIIGVLGRGGNARVFSADRQDHGPSALKVLNATNRDGERFRRFRREVETNESLRDHPGVLPVKESKLPDDPRQPAWLAMPVSVTLSDALAGAGVPEIVQAVAEVAETLADLASNGIAHRDIKPTNLYRGPKRALVGDFGLVDLPGVEPITGAAGINGPRHYVAWEVYAGGEDIDFRAADVFALAKTLWVLLTNQRFPPEGTHDPAERLTQIASFTPHPWAPTVDRIIAGATRINPQERTSMADLARELRSLAAEPPPVGSGHEDLAALAELQRLLEPSVSRHEMRSNLIRYLREHHQPRIEQAVEPVRARVAALQPVGHPWLPETATLGWRTLTEEMGAPEVLGGAGAGFIAYGPEGETGWNLTGGIQAELLADGTLRVLGVHAVFMGSGTGFREAFKITREAPLRSILADRAIEEVAAGLDRSCG